MENIDVLSVNVRGLNVDEKRKKIYNWLLESKFDIILLQETHFIQKYEDKYNFGWKG
jgi:exonuclease III